MNRQSTSIQNSGTWRGWLGTIVLVLLSLVVHWAVAAWGNSMPQISPFNDVNLYAQWAQRGLATNLWPGTNEPGVYPLLALVPMVISQWFYAGNAVYAWLIFITLLNTVAIAAVSRRVNGFRAGAYWLIFIVLLGPVAIGRIDAVAAAVDAFAVLAMLSGRDRLVLGLATAGAWIKIWPIVHAVSRLVALRSRDELARLIGVALAVSFGVLALGIALGGNENMFSFLWLMGNRGIQIESPIATPWVWGAHLGWGDSSIYFESNIITFQVLGPGSEVISHLMLPGLVLALAITVWLGLKAARAGATKESIFVLTALTATLDMIVFNKVGSPQFQAWLAVPVLAGILFGLPRWRLILGLSLASAALTQWVYPLNYDAVVAAEPTALGVLTARNLLLILMLIWANVRLGELSKTVAPVSSAAELKN